MAAAVNDLLKAKKIGEALTAALSNCPLDQEAPAESADIVLKVLTKGKDDADMQSAVSSLSEDFEDVLMRLLYVFLAKNQSSSVVLRWHQVLTEKAGVGCIMRAITA